MKIKLLTLAIVALTLLSCNKTTFNINVDLQNADGKMVYLQKRINNDIIVIDSAIIQNNILNFIAETDKPSTHYSIKIEGLRNAISFFTENQNTTISGDFNDIKNISINGCTAQQLVNEYNAENSKFYNQFRELRNKMEMATLNNDVELIESIEKEYELIENNMNNYIDLFLTKNSNSFVAPYILYNIYYNYELNELEDFVNNFNVDDNEYSRLLNEYIATLQRVDIGQPYLDFTQETPDGDLLSLSELVGKSKLLLIDFWASWCNPCRMENPNVVAVYNDFHEKGFDVLGVSLDMQKENWINAIEKDSLIWHNVSDLKYWSNEAAKSYGISSIPSNLLLDENGIIIAKNLRGEDLRNKVQEILK